MPQSNYTSRMDLFDEFLQKPRNDSWDGSEIHMLLEEVYQDYKASELQKRQYPKSFIHNRDLLSHLIKTYGH